MVQAAVPPKEGSEAGSSIVPARLDEHTSSQDHVILRAIFGGRHRRCFEVSGEALTMIDKYKLMEGISAFILLSYAVAGQQYKVTTHSGHRGKRDWAPLGRPAEAKGPEPGVRPKRRI